MALQSIRSSIQDLRNNYYDLIDTSDFGILTWLSFGAVIQLLCLAYLPPRVAMLPPILWIIYRVIKATLDTRGLFVTSFTDIKRGRWTVEIPQPKELTGTNDGVVCFLLGARINHPWGKLAPGNVKIDQIFKDMWREAEENREKWSYLGHTPTLLDTSDTVGTTNLWISYWKDLKGLQAFSHSAAHRLGKDGFGRGEFPYMGIMHETFFAKGNCWEGIYDGFREWGMGTLKVGGEKDEEDRRDTWRVNERGSTMFSRMGRHR